MQFLKNMGVYIFVFCVIIGFIFINAGLEHNNWLFTGIGIVSALIGLLIYFIQLSRSKIETKNHERIEKRRIEEIKKMGRRSTIDLENVKITPTKWEKDYSGNKSLHSYDLSIPFGKDIIYYPAVVSQNLKNLEIHFALKRHTAFYHHNGEYYLNLAFLH